MARKASDSFLKKILTVVDWWTPHSCNARLSCSIRVIKEKRMTFENCSSWRAREICSGTAIGFVVSLLAGCMSVDVGLGSFMSADRGPNKAKLAQGYTVRDFIIRYGYGSIGVTHARYTKSHAIIIYCGGDSFHRSVEGAEVLEALAQGADVILFDYPGYGESTGTLSAAGILETALEVYDYATALEGAAGKKRIVYGFSLGGLVAAYMAGSRQVDGVVLEATAQNADSWVRSQIPWYMSPVLRPRIEPELATVDALTALRHFDGRVLLLGSRGDRKAPAALTSQLHRRLLQAGVQAKRVLFDGAAHGGSSMRRGFDPRFGLL